MTRYILRYTVDGIERERHIKTVENMSYGEPQSLIKKEALGQDGGLTVNTGRTSIEITLTGLLLHTRQPGTTNIIESWNDVQKEILRVKRNGYTVTLESPMESEDSDRFFIEDFTLDLTKGNETSAPFTIKLAENRQANVRIDIINLIAIGPREEFLTRYRTSLQGVN